MLGEIFDEKTKAYTPVSYINEQPRKRGTLAYDASELKGRNSLLKYPRKPRELKNTFKPPTVEGPPNAKTINTDILSMLEANTKRAHGIRKVVPVKVTALEETGSSSDRGALPDITIKRTSTFRRSSTRVGLKNLISKQIMADHVSQPRMDASDGDIKSARSFGGSEKQTGPQFSRKVTNRRGDLRARMQDYIRQY